MKAQLNKIEEKRLFTIFNMVSQKVVSNRNSESFSILEHLQSDSFEEVGELESEKHPLYV